MLIRKNLIYFGKKIIYDSLKTIKQIQDVLIKKIGFAKTFMLFIISPHFNYIMILNHHEQKCT
jgi:hypothetical protein